MCGRVCVWARSVLVVSSRRVNIYAISRAITKIPEFRKISSEKNATTTK